MRRSRTGNHGGQRARAATHPCRRCGAGRGIPALHLRSGRAPRPDRLGAQYLVRRGHHRAGSARRPGVLPAGDQGGSAAPGPHRPGDGRAAAPRRPAADDLHHPPQRRRRRGILDRAGRGHLPRLPGGNPEPGRPPLPLPLHQLHQLRAALHHHRSHALRPADDHHARLRHVPGLPGGIRRPAEPPLSRPAERLPGLRAAPAPDRPGRRARRLARGLPGRHRPRGGAAAGRVHRGDQGAGRLPPGLRRYQRGGCGPPARAQSPPGQALRRDAGIAGGGAPPLRG